MVVINVPDSWRGGKLCPQPVIDYHVNDSHMYHNSGIVLKSMQDWSLKIEIIRNVFVKDNCEETVRGEILVRLT